MWAPSTENPSPIGLETERVYELVPKNWDKFDRSYQASYDKVKVVVDNRNDQDKKVYLVYQGELYAMQGFNQMAAVGIKDSLKAVIPTGSGSFSVAVDMSKITSDKSGDPFYQSPPSASATISWQKNLNPVTVIGAGLSITKNRPFFMFADPDTTSPALTTNAGREIRGIVYISSHF